MVEQVTASFSWCEGKGGKVWGEPENWCGVFYSSWSSAPCFKHFEFRACIPSLCVCACVLSGRSSYLLLFLWFPFFSPSSCSLHHDWKLLKSEEGTISCPPASEGERLPSSTDISPSVFSLVFFASEPFCVEWELSHAGFLLQELTEVQMMSCVTQVSWLLF